MCHRGLVLVSWLLSGSSLVSALQAPMLVPTTPGLSPRLLLNNSLLSTIAVTEGAQQTITFYLDDIPDDYVGELLLQISSADGLEHLTISPNTFPVNRNATTANKPVNFPTLPPATWNGDHTDQRNKNDENVSPGVNPSYSSGDASMDATRGRYLEGEFTASGVFLGFSSVTFVMVDDNDRELLQSDPVLAKVRRGDHLNNTLFSVLVVMFIIIIYVQMGCTLDLEVIKQIVRRPVAPAIGLFLQYTVMPLSAYGFGYLFLSSTPELWLGLFLIGCSPGGGPSNMWTYLLGGSLDLSVTMTFFSTLISFVGTSVWLWALAPTIVADGQFDSIPYRTIMLMLAVLLFPLAVGIGLTRWYPRRAAQLNRLLKPFAMVYILFMLTYGAYVHSYIFSFITLPMLLGCMFLPITGNVIGFLVAKLARRSAPEVIAISVEIGVQNLAIAIALLKVALSNYSPLGDIAVVVPVTVALGMTPVPLFIAYLVVVVRDRRAKRVKANVPVETSLSVPSSTPNLSLSPEPSSSPEPSLSPEPSWSPNPSSPFISYSH